MLKRNKLSFIHSSFIHSLSTLVFLRFDSVVVIVKKMANASSFDFFVKVRILVVVVVYFNQRLGAAHSKRWSK